MKKNGMMMPITAACYVSLTDREKVQGVKVCLVMPSSGRYWGVRPWTTALPP